MCPDAGDRFAVFQSQPNVHFQYNKGMWMLSGLLAPSTSEVHKPKQKPSQKKAVSKLQGHRCLRHSILLAQRQESDKRLMVGRERRLESEEGLSSCPVLLPAPHWIPLGLCRPWRLHLLVIGNIHFFSPVFLNGIKMPKIH